MPVGLPLGGGGGYFPVPCAGGSGPEGELGPAGEFGPDGELGPEGEVGPLGGFCPG